MPFVKGQSGNYKGRPPKERALTAILQAALDRKFGEIALKQIMAKKMAFAIATGEIEFTNGKKTRRIKLDSDQWMQLIKFVYSHVDGPARAELDVNANTTQVQVNLYLPKKDNDGNS